MTSIDNSNGDLDTADGVYGLDPDTEECPDCEGEGYRYNSPLASRKGECPLCCGIGRIGVAP